MPEYTDTVHASDPRTATARDDARSTPGTEANRAGVERGDASGGASLPGPASDAAAPRERVELDKGHALRLRETAVCLVGWPTGHGAGELPLGEETWLSYAASPLWHQLQIGELSFRLSPARARRALHLLAVGRLRARAQTSSHWQKPPLTRPLLDLKRPLAQAALLSVLGEGEVALCWSKLRGRHTLASKLGGQRRATAYLLATDQRLCRYLISDAGDVSAEQALVSDPAAAWLKTLPPELLPLRDALLGPPAERPRSILDAASARLSPPPPGARCLPGAPCPAAIAQQVSIADAWLELTRGQAAYAERLHERVLLGPLDRELLSELRDVASADLAARIETVLALLAGRTASELPAPPTALRPLPKDEVERAFRVKPLDALSTRLQTWVAHSRTPELGTLRQYCERPRDSTAVVLQSVDQIATWLGLGHVEVFISRGANDVGLRAIPGGPPFLLVGGQHLEPDSRYWLSPSALRFALAAELAHLRLGNVRVAPHDVLRGSIRRGRQGVDVALGVLPLVGSLRLANRLGVVTAKLTLPQVMRTLEAAKEVPEALTQSQTSTHELSTPNEALVYSQRGMQFGADRAGLIACRSLCGAVQALLRTRSAYVRTAVELAEHGLLDALDRQHAGSSAAVEDLRRRLLDLVAFYLSGEYPRLLALSTPE